MGRTGEVEGGDIWVVFQRPIKTLNSEISLYVGKRLFFLAKYIIDKKTVSQSSLSENQEYG